MSEHDVAPNPPASCEDSRRRWWGEFRFGVGVWGHWQVGPLMLWLGRSEHDWQVAYTRDRDPLCSGYRLDVPADLAQTPVPDDAHWHRVGFSRTSEVLELRPALADRPIVARPEKPFSIPTGERVSAFVSSAVWVRLSCKAPSALLVEIPSWRSSDTWFGDNRSGFLCYATRTTMRLQVEEIPYHPHRVVTQLVIDNQGTDTLQIDRLSLPVPNLSVFASPAGVLWTEQVHLTRREDAELADIHIDADHPPVPGAERLTDPRRTGQQRLLARVFTGLFG